jgi:hypothetical protein
VSFFAWKMSFGRATQLSDEGMALFGFVFLHPSLSSTTGSASNPRQLANLLFDGSSDVQ